MKKANAILKRPINKLFPTEHTYHDTNQTDISMGNKCQGKKQPQLMNER